MPTREHAPVESAHTPIRTCMNTVTHHNANEWTHFNVPMHEHIPHVGYAPVSLKHVRTVPKLFGMRLNARMRARGQGFLQCCTRIKKENQIFLIYKEIQSGAVAKSYLRKGFQIYEEMRKYFPIYEEAVSHIWLCNCSTLNFLIHKKNLIFFFISVGFPCLVFQTNSLR